MPSASTSRGLPATILLRSKMLRVASALALWVVSRREMRLGQALRGSVVMGLGIAAMHYTGMASMRLPATTSYQPLLVAGSVVLAVTVSFVALWRAFQLREPSVPAW